MSCNRDAIDAHFAADLAPREERVLRLHLADCADCRGYYERHLLLARLDPAAKPAEERLAAGLGLRRRRRWMWVPAVATAAAALLLMVRPDGMTPRGKPVTVESSVTVMLPSGKPVEASIRAADELAFAYRNPEGYARLLIFGVDEHQHVYWYYPAWQDPAADPVAVPIEKGVEAHTLGEVVAHSLDGGRLELHALFTNRALTARQVEERVNKGVVAGDGERDVPRVLGVAH